MEPETYELIIGIDLPRHEDRPGDTGWRGETRWITVAENDSAGPILRLAQAFALADLPLAVKVNPVPTSRVVSPSERALSVPMATTILNAVKGALDEGLDPEPGEEVNLALRRLRAWTPAEEDA